MNILNLEFTEAEDNKKSNQKEDKSVISAEAEDIIKTRIILATSQPSWRFKRDLNYSLILIVINVSMRKKFLSKFNFLMYYALLVSPLAQVLLPGSYQELLKCSCLALCP